MKEYPMNIYVGNLSEETTAEELRLEFLSFGRVASVSLISDRSIGSGQGRTCAFVEMPVIGEADLAVEKLKCKSLRGRQIEVIKALPTKKDPRIQTSGTGGLSAFYRKIANRDAPSGK
jgi:cold-inducible RNA-binding protein